MLVNATLEAAATGYLAIDAFPWICFKLLHTKADALCFRVEADDLNRNRLADLQRFGWMVDATPAMSVTCSRPSTPPRSTNAP